MHKSQVVTVSTVITSLLHIFWCYLFVAVFDLDVVGLGLASLISYTSNFLIVTTFCLTKSDLKDCFFFTAKGEVWLDLREYLKIGIPSAIMLCSEWGIFELLTLVVSYISIDAIGAQIIGLNIFAVFVMVPHGGQIGTLACVGKAMGENNPKKA